MKKIIFVLAMCACTMAANAQLWVGGSFGLNVNKIKGADKSSVMFTLSPEVGYDLNEKWAVAGALNIATSNEELKPFQFSLNPYARYKFAHVGIATFFADGGVTFGIESMKFADKRECYGLVGVGIRPGVSLEVNDHLSFEAKTGYLGYNFRDANKSHSFGMGLNTEALSFGLYYNF